MDDRDADIIERMTELYARVMKRLREAWPYLLLLVFIIIPLLVMAAILAIRSNLYTTSGAPPSNEQLKVFLAFIGGGLATAATVIASLLTWQHNKRAQRQLQLETVVKALESLPEGEPRVAGSIATMVLLGHQAVAMRVLDPAWKEGSIDSGTATWLIGQVLCNNHKDKNAVSEAASTLLKHTADLTKKDAKGYMSVPGNCFTIWHKEFPVNSRKILLIAIGKTLVTQEKDWWLTDHQPMSWPASIFAEAMRKDSDTTVKRCAAVLLHALFDCFEGLQNIIKDGKNVQQIAETTMDATAAGDIPEVFWELAAEIRNWGGVASKSASSAIPAGGKILAA